MKTKAKKLKIGIFGFGNMGQAIFSILTKMTDKRLYVSSLDLSEAKDAICVPTMEDLLTVCDVIFVCIKPQDFYNLIVDKKIAQKSSAIIISIMAGVTINDIKKIIPTKKIIRTMPNLALQSQEAVTGWHTVKNNFSKKELDQAVDILKSFGLTVFTKNEDMLNAITAISGSGPAYVFLFIDALIDSAKSLGFSKDDAEKIVYQTLTGSITYAKTQKDSSLKELIGKVTSKKGTTEAALKELDTKIFYKKWLDATKKACQRAKELSSK